MSIRSLLTLCVILIVAGCASHRQCPACENLQQAVIDPYPCTAATIDLAAPNLTPGMHALFLSGGGSFGAYGAGVINGWSLIQSGDHVRTTFTVVTGISTGALQATHAFLGKPNDIYMYKNYTESGTELMPPRPWWQLLFASSVNTTTGLQEVLELTVTNAMIDAVGQERGKRLLCVGTTNLDTGRFVSWDLTKIASEHRYELYRSLLLASASVPAASPPVEVYGSLHGDGGVRHQLFAVPLLEQILQVRQNANDRFYFLVNGQLSAQAQCTEERILPLAERAINLLMVQGLESDLLEAELTVKPGGGPGGGQRTFFRYIPNEYPLPFNNGEFEKDQMCRLYCKGRYDGKAADWTESRPEDLPPRPCKDQGYWVGDAPDDSSCPASGAVCPVGYNPP